MFISFTTAEKSAEVEVKQEDTKDNEVVDQQQTTEEPKPANQPKPPPPTDGKKAPHTFGMFTFHSDYSVYDPHRYHK